MSLLEAVTNVANECGYVVDTARVIAASDVTSKQLLAMAQRVIREMGQAYPWTKLYRSGSITLQFDQNQYALPGDFSYYHYETFWDSSKHWRLYGPLSPEEYGDIQGYGLTAAPYSQFQIRGATDSQFYIYPTPSDNGEVVIYQYISDRFVRPRTWVTGLAVTAGSYISYNGNYYIAQNSGTTGVFPPIIQANTNDGVIQWNYYTGSYSKFLADTDEPIFSQRIFEQGLLERFAEIKQLAVTPRFTDQLNEEFSRNIPGKILWADGNTNGYVLQARNGTVLFGRGYNY